MCIAGLNVAQPCGHRWYILIQPCNPSIDLSNCQEKLRLQGWETRHESCPWCGDSSIDGETPALDDSTHRLFGSMSSSSSNSSNASSSTPTSPILAGKTLPGTGRIVRQRSGSGGSLSNSLSRVNSINSVVLENERALRHREMNDRLNLYLSCDPHEVLPSGKKHYPDYQGSPTLERAGTFSDSSSVRRGSVKGWKKAVQLSRGMYKG
ncbi:hypothetical protein K431DRAFT_146264 [Polychaeton citri CBS 116435]|uniref:Uncharacterized protein n=1 Tax=Polychaeton citri CBS 116435 TaxID=1314669 RepID=A0A9P4QF78_9PEZI|nr:hypothetical protein K431DRAFT_146264 [Polychaeton citri CBS 116435]